MPPFDSAVAVSKADMEQGGGFSLCDGLHAPIHLWELLALFAFWAIPVAVAGCLRGFGRLALHAAGVVLLAILVMMSMASSWLMYRWGIFVGESCLPVLDNRISGPLLIVLNAGLLLVARLSRSTTRQLLRPKPEARGPKPS